jgi:hypothetical protein
MKIELKEIPIQDIVRYSSHLKKCQGYKDNGEEGVYGMGGRLNIRPAYQREFIYKDSQRNAVTNTILNNFPLNVLYWIMSKDGSYEVLDGQQRLISIGQYLTGSFSLNFKFFHNLVEGELNPIKFFHNLKEEELNQILNYKLMVYFCEGTDSEKLNWFKTINIAGAKLEEQELRNAIYTGPWLSDAKRYFSRNNCPAYQIASNYLVGNVIRQDYLEAAISWRSKNQIEEYMALNQFNVNAIDLWNSFEKTIAWFKSVFPTYRKEMKGLPIGELYNNFNQNEYNSIQMEEFVNNLMADEDVEKKKGIYQYVFDGNEKHLSIRKFKDSVKRYLYETQNGICVHCGKQFEIEDMEADHITPWSKGGKTVPENCQILCLNCNRTKSAK